MKADIFLVTLPNRSVARQAKMSMKVETAIENVSSSGPKVATSDEKVATPSEKEVSSDEKVASGAMRESF